MQHRIARPAKFHDHVTIADVLRLALPLHTKLISGGENVRLPINWVSILTSKQNITSQVKRGDIVLLPPSLQKSLTLQEFNTQITTLSQLAATGYVLFDIPPLSVRETADRLSFPILIPPEGATLREVQRTISALLIDRQMQTTERGMQLYRLLSEMSREDQGLEAMTSVMAQLTGKIVVVQDKRLEIQALSVPSHIDVATPTLKTSLEDTEKLPSVLRNRKAAAKARQTHWQQPLQDLEGYSRIISPIISGDRARGYVSVIGNTGDLDLLDTLTAEHGAAACALEMAKAKAVSEAKKQLRGDFIEGLLSGSTPVSEIERLEGRLDHDTHQPHAVMTFAWDEARSNLVTLPSLRRLETTVNWLIASQNRPGLVHLYGEEYVCVFLALRENDDISTIGQDFDHQLREQLKVDYADSHMVSGLSGPVNTLSQWPMVYKQALQAMQLGQRLNATQLVEFSNLGVYQLLGQLEGIEVVHGFAEKIVGPLADYDLHHRSSLMLTLDAYFRHHGNISQTAEALFIHRNTLLYRLERIQELTGHYLNQADMRLALHLALKLWQLRPQNESP